MQDAIKICGRCTHARLVLGIVASLDFKVKLKMTLRRLTKQCETTDNISIDNDLFEVLALLNWLQRQKFYCKREKGWTHLFDVACYAWQPREGSTSSESVF